MDPIEFCLYLWLVLPLHMIDETYWGRNKGRSMEGMLVKITKILAVFFMLLAVVLNLNVF